MALKGQYIKRGPMVQKASQTFKPRASQLLPAASKYLYTASSCQQSVKTKL